MATLATLTDVFGNSFQFTDEVPIREDDQELIRQTVVERAWTVLVISPRNTVQARQAFALMTEYVKHIDPTLMMRADASCIIWTSGREPLTARAEFLDFTKKVKIVQSVTPINPN